jgi:hypothetical protein
MYVAGFFFFFSFLCFLKHLCTCEFNTDVMSTIYKGSFCFYFINCCNSGLGCDAL